MLPFFHPKRAVAVIVARRGKPDVEVKSEAGGKDLPDGLLECAEDMLRASDERSAIGLAQALKSAFQILESQPHEEADSEEEGEE